MNKQTTKAMVLKRLDYGDADRIITVLTPNFGKLSLIAKGVRKIKSKLAGGIELFAVFDAGYISGRGEVGTLTSARLDEYYGNIINDIKRVKLGYEILKAFDQATEGSVESAYFFLLCQLLRLLNDQKIPLSRLEIYFKSQLLLLGGQAPNLVMASNQQLLKEKARYRFSIPQMGLIADDHGILTASHIKLMRLLFDGQDAHKVFNLRLSGQDEELRPLIDAMFRTYL